jgi:hypothetical protein
MSDLKQFVPLIEKTARYESRVVIGIESPNRLVSCSIDQLEPHPALIRHSFGSCPEEVAGLENLGDRAFTEPLLITQGFLIVSGWTRWRYACRSGQTTLLCLQRSMTDEEAILEILKSSQGRGGVNDYNRIVMALELEPSLREQANSNQRLSGHAKGSSNLTTADPIDVRAKIARTANVSTGNVTKVKQLNQSADPEIILAVQRGVIQIHMAWTWSKTSLEEQRRNLKHLRSQRGLRHDVRKLVAKHRSKKNRIGQGFQHLGSAMAIFKAELESPLLTNALEDLYVGLALQNPSDCGHIDAA